MSEVDTAIESRERVEIRPRRKVSYGTIMEAARLYIAEERPNLQTPDAVADYFRPIFQKLKQEELWVLLLDTKNNAIDAVMVTRGLVDRSQAHAREIFREAIVKNATHIVLAHNHPSGDPMPSVADINMTKSIVEAGKIIGIEVTDHVIIGKMEGTKREVDYYGFRENGLIK